jgi:hypothetical protein
VARYAPRKQARGDAVNRYLTFQYFTKAKKPTAKGTKSDVETLAGKLEPKLAAAILDAISKQAGKMSISALIKALESGDVGMVLKLLDLEELADEMSGVNTALNDVTWKAGGVAAGTISTATGVTFGFNQLNPKLITHMQGYSFNLIKNINDTTREGVREYMQASMFDGTGPRETARQIKQIVGLTPKQARAVKNFRKELETFHLKRTAGGYNLGGKIDRVNGAQVFKPDESGLPMDEILERRLRDFRYDGQLKTAMSTGKPLTKAQIDKMVEGYSRKYRKFRAETIARTEALRAVNIGTQDAWRQAVETGKANETQLRRRWSVAEDERRCETCSPIPSMNPKLGVKFAQPFSTPKGPVMLPPIHPNCRCSIFIRSYTQQQIDAAEKKSK